MKNYATHRARIKTGDVIAWQGRGLFASIVRLFTRSPWTHVAIAVWWGPRLMILDSYIGRGTQARPLSNHLENAHWLPSDAEWNPAAHAFALDELEKPYSLQNLWKTWLGLGLVRQEYHCAQYVAEVLGKAGIELSMPPTPESIVRELGAKATPVGLGI